MNHIEQALQKLSQTASQTDEHIEYLNEKAKMFEKKTSERIRSLNDDYQRDMIDVGDTIKELQKLIDSKVKLSSDAVNAKIVEIKKLLTLG